MVLSMGTTNTLYLPHRINIAMRFNFNAIFYVQYRSEEISPPSRLHHFAVLLCGIVSSEYYIHHHQEDYTILCIDSQCFTFIHGTKQIIPWCRDVFVLHQDDKRRQQTRKDRATQPIMEAGG